MGFAEAGGYAMKLELLMDGSPVTLENVARSAQSLTFERNGKTYSFRSQRLPDGATLLEQEVSAGVWKRMSAASWQVKDVRRVQLGHVEASISEVKKGAAHGGGEGVLSPVAPMPGLIRQILVSVGDAITRGTPLLVMEAMKLQTTIAAVGDGVVEVIRVKEGDLVTDGAELIKLRPSDKK